jgi:hypothetical protein
MRVPGSGSCARCLWFEDRAAVLESEIAGLGSLSSARGSTRADDGLCALHERFVGPAGRCSHFSAARPAR